MKSKEMADSAYKPVKKYVTYLRGLERLEVVGITVIATDVSDFKRAEWAVLVELVVLP